MKNNAVGQCNWTLASFAIGHRYCNWTLEKLPYDLERHYNISLANRENQ